MTGQVRKAMSFKRCPAVKSLEIIELGVINPNMNEAEVLQAGEVGYLAAGIKNVADTKVGDTITLATNPAASPLPGYQEVKPMVYCGLYPLENNDFERLRDALDRLKLNDASLLYEAKAQMLWFWVSVRISAVCALEIF